MCFTELHDEELNNDEEDEDEEGHQDEQQDTTLSLLQAYVLSAGFCEDNGRVLGNLVIWFCGFLSGFSYCGM